MSYQVLARKYRPQRFSDVIGQEHVTRTLKNALEQQRIAHGYIFSGHRGIGKTTIARILAMALNCRSKDHPVAEPCGVCESCTEIRAGNAVDVIEIDAATNRGIDEIRELREAARYRPARDRYKIYILDEAHQITDAAFNALLKTLEEPPGHVIFMMATTQPEDIPQTIRSRCQHFSFHAVKFDDIVAQLRDIAAREKISADDNALALLAEAGDGSMRDALSIMDQAIACCGTKLTAETVRGLAGAVASEVLEEMLQSVARNSAEEVMRQVDRLLTEGHNPAHFARQMVRFLRNATVAKVAGKDSSLLQISSDERERVARVAELFSEEDLARFLQIMLRTHGELGYRQEQRIHLELGLLKLVHAQRLLPLEQMLSQGAPAAPLPGGSRSLEEPRISAPTRSAPSGTSRPSPFETDVARKTVEPAEAPRRTPRSETISEPAAMSSFEPTATIGSLAAVALAPDPAPKSEPQAITAGELRNQVLVALENAGFRGLAMMLEAGEWTLGNHELAISVADKPTVVEMALSTEAARVASSAASAAAGRTLKLKVHGGSNGITAQPAALRPSGPGARTRAADEPVVKRMQEKFGAQIRTVIDHREKR